MILGVLLIIGVGVYTGILQDLWDRYRPLTAEESASLEATMAMQEDVSGRKESLHAARIILSQKIIQAEEEQSEELPILQETLGVG